MAVGRYTLRLIAQTLLLLLDLTINTFGILFRKYSLALLLLFILQDVGLLLSLALLLIALFGTRVWKSGFGSWLIEKFRAVLVISLIYFLLTTILYVWMLIESGSKSLKYHWSVGLHIFYILHRMMAPLYYYFYKRAALRLSDPRFYMDINLERKSSTNLEIRASNCVQVCDNK